MCSRPAVQYAHWTSVSSSSTRFPFAASMAPLSTWSNTFQRSVFTRAPASAAKPATAVWAATWLGPGTPTLSCNGL
jgi:hypothetical protein